MTELANLNFPVVFALATARLIRLIRVSSVGSLKVEGAEAGAEAGAGSLFLPLGPPAPPPPPLCRRARRVFFFKLRLFLKVFRILLIF